MNARVIQIFRSIGLATLKKKSILFLIYFDMFYGNLIVIESAIHESIKFA